MPRATIGVRPQWCRTPTIAIDRRHPVVEKQDRTFYRNDCGFDAEQRLLLIYRPETWA